MDEAIDLAIEGRSPYPEKAAFIDAGVPSAGHAIERAVNQGRSVVLVSADGTARVLRPDLAPVSFPKPFPRESGSWDSAC
ncbi:MAG: hypothetical protein ACM3Q9_02040 [Methanosarcina sp.]